MALRICSTHQKGSVSIKNFLSIYAEFKPADEATEKWHCAQI